MNQVLRRKGRLRLAVEDYRRLQQLVLARDGWRCQLCGSPMHLQVHHRQLRSHSGDDTEENLITLCTECHRRIHR
jgi:5-methylcytosine-specific restriction endonuclease McrA